MDSRALRHELPDIEEWDKLIRNATDEELCGLEVHVHAWLHDDPRWSQYIVPCLEEWTRRHGTASGLNH